VWSFAFSPFLFVVGYPAKTIEGGVLEKPRESNPKLVACPRCGNTVLSACGDYQYCNASRMMEGKTIPCGWNTRQTIEPSMAVPAR
jgi:hypothetical protein